MEQKRTLWIIAAVGIFLLVVFGAAAILYSPASRPARTITASAPVNKRNTSGWVSAPADTNQLPEQSSGRQTAPETSPSTTETAPTTTSAAPADPNDTSSVAKVNGMTVIAQNTTVYGDQKRYPQTRTPATTIDLNSINKSANKSAAGESENVTPKNEVGAQAIESAKKEKRYTAPAGETEKTAPATSGTVPVKKTRPVKKVFQSRQKETANNKIPVAVSGKIITTKPSIIQYWVQAAAFSNKKSADNALTVLDDNKIPANVFTYQDNKGALFYRVRIGPYMTKSEAEYWRTRIIKIDVFSKAESYITSTKSAAN
jgi:cell division septation protein DedD